MICAKCEKEDLYHHKEGGWIHWKLLNVYSCNDNECFEECRKRELEILYAK